jgi:hypothetical protein
VATNKAAFNALQHILTLTEEAVERKERNPAAVALGRLGGLKGGAARARSLSAGRLREIAQKAAKARWKAKNR